MRQLLRYKEWIIYASFSVCFILFALLYRWENDLEVAIFSLPFVWIGDAIRLVGTKVLPIAYILYILVALSPLIFPAIRLFRTKKPTLCDIAWLGLSVFLFVILYFFINPHRIRFAVFGSDVPDEVMGGLRSITLIAFSITAYAILLLCLLLEGRVKLNKKQDRVYLYAKILFSVLIVGVLFNLLFVRLYSTRAEILSIPKESELPSTVDFDRPINVFAVVFAYILNIAPAVFTILLFLQSKSFVSSLQKDAFSKNNILVLNKIIKTSMITVFVSLGVLIVENVFYMLLLSKLQSSIYNIGIPTTMILTACLIIIFSKILIGAIEISEENKLVI